MGIRKPGERDNGQMGAVVVMRCSERMPDQDRHCVQPDEHTGQHQDEFGVKWSILTEPVGFTREELTAAAARQAKVAPSKEEILETINTQTLGMNRDRVVRLLRAVEKLYADRGL